MKIITSLTSPVVKRVVRLHAGKGRKEAAQFIAEGARVIGALLDAGWVPDEAYVDGAGSKTEVGERLCMQSHALLVSEAVMKKMSAAVTPSGLLAVFPIPQKLELTELCSPGIILAKISDPGNMGTLIRSAAAFSFQVVVIGGADVWSPKVIQSSAGAVAHAPIFQTTWQQLVTTSRARGQKLYALVAQRGGPPEESSLDSNGLLVVGSEAHGIPLEWENDCDERITLEMSGNAESLNAAVAGSIAMYIVSRKSA